MTDTSKRLGYDEQMRGHTGWIGSWALVAVLAACGTEPARTAPAPLVTAASPSTSAPSSDRGPIAAPAAPPASSEEGHADAGGGASTSTLSAGDQAVVRAVYPQILACYKRGLAADKDLHGVVSFTLDLGDGGKVASAAPVSSSFPGAFPGAVLDCMTKKLEALRFERAKGSRSEPLSVAFRCIPPNAYDGPARVEDGSKPKDLGY